MTLFRSCLDLRFHRVERLPVLLVQVYAHGDLGVGLLQGFVPDLEQSVVRQVGLARLHHLVRYLADKHTV